nr:hypothetical protein [Nocardia beijingensis]
MSQLEDPHDRRCAFGVHDESGFGASLFSFGRDRVRDPLVEVAVERFADVPALFGMFAVAFPGLFESVAQEPFGHTLFHAPHQDLGGAFLRQRDRPLIGGVQRHANSFQLVFELSGLMGPPRGAFDLLHHHCLEPAIGVACFGQQVGQSPVAGNRDVERLVRVAATALFEVLAGGLHIVEERHDHEPGR